MNQTAQENDVCAQPEAGCNVSETTENLSSPFRGIPCLQAEAVHGLIKQRDEIRRLVMEASRLFFQAGEIAEGMSVYLPVLAANREIPLKYSGVEAINFQIDRQCWCLLMDRSGLTAYMGQGARKLWEESLNRADALPLALDNIEIVFRERYTDRSNLFEDGVIEFVRAFLWDWEQKLPRRLGIKYIQGYLLTEYGSVRSEQSAKLDELMRIFYVLDGRPESVPRIRLMNALESAYRNGVDMQNEFMRVAMFQNGNGHVYFQRLDLVAKINEAIVKHFPNALPPSK